MNVFPWHLPMRSTSGWLCLSSRGPFSTGSLCMTVLPVTAPCSYPGVLHGPLRFPYRVLYLCKQFVANKASLVILT